MAKHNNTPEKSLQKERGKDTNFRPIKRRIKSEKLFDLYLAEIQEMYGDSFSPYNPEHLEQVEQRFQRKYLKQSKSGGLIWKVI
jgi:hypothetical protein